MKVLLFCFILYSYGVIQAQNESVFYLKVLDSLYVPTTTHDRIGNRVNISRTGNITLDALINKYEIYESKKVFKGSKKASLQNMYLIRCNNVKLMNDLYENFKYLYPRIIEVPQETLYTPDDIGVTGGYTGVDQEELNYINAQEAWDITKGNPLVVIGVADNYVQPTHEDFAGKMTHVYGTNYPNLSSGDAQHGSWVSSLAAASTDNNKGMSAIGFDSSIYAASYSRTDGVSALSMYPEVKVINTAWISGSNQELQDAYDEVVEDNGKVVVASAGNGNGGSSSYVFPAAFGNVISVSAIGHQDESYIDDLGSDIEVFLDDHSFRKNGNYITYQHNDSVDIVAPGYGVSMVNPISGSTNTYKNNRRGTSYSSPIVSGTIALMFSVNYCIDPKEVETILKLTAVKIDTLPQNQFYYGKLGAGKLDAYEAVKMSKDMADSFGTVEVKNRILYRPWFYKLVTAPYEIKMTNNDVSGGSKLKFRARNNIEILSGNYYPNSGGYIDLAIDSSLALDCPPPPGAESRQTNIYNNNIDSNIEIVPTLVSKDLKVFSKFENNENISSIKIYNFFGVEVFYKDKIDFNDINLDLSNLTEGIHIIKIYNRKGEVIHTQKIIKK